MCYKYIVDLNDTIRLAVLMRCDYVNNGMMMMMMMILMCFLYIIWSAYYYLQITSYYLIKSGNLFWLVRASFEMREMRDEMRG